MMLAQVTSLHQDPYSCEYMRINIPGMGKVIVSPSEAAVVRSILEALHCGYNETMLLTADYNTIDELRHTGQLKKWWQQLRKITPGMRNQLIARGLNP